MSSARDWDAVTYDRVSGPQVAWAEELLERLDLEGDETVLDAGCGSGRVTRLLVERLPNGRVIAVDAAPAMVAKAREQLGDEVEVHHQDLIHLHLRERVDVVFSNAVFHWIKDHDRLFECIHKVLKPGGRLVAQCGGEGNIEHLHALVSEIADGPPFASFFENWTGPWNFASPQDTERRLRRAGFDEVRCWSHPSPVTPAEPHDFIRTVCLGHHLDQLPDELRETLLGRVVETMPAPVTLEYVRLNIDARKPA